MKIMNSAVGMSSSHSQAKLTSTITQTTLKQNGVTRRSISSAGSLSASLDLSAEAKAQIKERRRMLSDLEKEAAANNLRNNQTSGNIGPLVPSSPDSGEDKFNFQALKKILEAMGLVLKEWSSPKEDLHSTGDNTSLDLRKRIQGGSAGNSTTWNRQTQVSSFTAEAEATVFSSNGIVQTNDGRQISFHVDLEMSREFLSANEYIKEDTVKILTDPLVINLDVDQASVSDQKFYFDLNIDGKKDEISSLNSGSGFLALDRNHDGIINDGSELFGAKTGDGFSELASFDQDGNGWIDENDDIFNSLVVWTKDKDGNDKLLTLKSANVGAIYLGNVSTDFSLNDAVTNETNAQIRKTGIYLHETGEAGTIQHLDFSL